MAGAVVQGVGMGGGFVLLSVFRCPIPCRPAYLKRGPFYVVHVLIPSLQIPAA